MYTFFIQIYLSLLEIYKECLMREGTKHRYKICTRLVGSQITQSMLIYNCWVMVVLFHNILSSMTKLKININCYHVHMWEVILVKGVTIVFKKYGLLHYQNLLKHFYGVNKWNAKYKILAEFGENYGYCKREDS